MKYVLIGKLVNTHGLKGECRILSNFRYKDRIFKNGMKIYIGHDKICEEIVNYRPHKIFDMIMMKGYNNINEVLKYKGEYVFVNKEDIILYDNEYLDEDIVGLKVIVGNTEIGKIVRIDDHNGNRVLVVKNDKKNYLIPYNFDIIDSVRIDTREMIILDIPGLFN